MNFLLTVNSIAKGRLGHTLILTNLTDFRTHFELLKRVFNIGLSGSLRTRYIENLGLIDIKIKEL